MSNGAFEGKVVLITGAGAGLGRQYARDFARRGACVMINDIVFGDAEAAQRAVDELEKLGGRAVADAGNVSQETACRAMVDRVVRTFGRIDIVINNAGNSIAGTAQQVSTADFAAVLNVHLFGTFWIQQSALQHMRRNGFGRIVNTASALGAFGREGAAPYVTAKAAIIGLTRAAALDNADLDVRVNALCPIAYTPMAKGFHDRLGHFTPEEIDPSKVSPAVLFLAHPDCRLSGETLSAGAGRIARIFSATTKGVTSPDWRDGDVFEHQAQILDTDGFVMLRSSREQYEKIFVRADR